MSGARRDGERGEMDWAPRRGGGAPTRRSCAVAASFGYLLDEPASEGVMAPDAGAVVGAGGLTLILGPSGSGKSMLLRAVEREWSGRGVVVIRPPVALPDRPAVELFRGLSVEDALGALSRAGLGEVGCFVRRPRELSDGQRDRLRLALAMRGAESAAREGAGSAGGMGALLVIDEFAGLLDGVTARSVAALVRRFIDGSGRGVGAVIASPREEVGRWLRPDRTIRLSSGAPPRVEEGGGWEGADPLGDVTIGSGSRGEYEALAPLHYRASHPATMARILVARRRGAEGGDEVAGVLVVSMPVLNGRWRELAWPGRYTGGDKRERARRLNEEVRCVSRVIIDPRFRALGLARRLVKAYLAAPMTPCVEAVAAMGRASPFFERAGMTAYALAPSRRDARLLDALERVGVEAWRLATPGTALVRARSSPLGARFIESEARRWASSSRGGAMGGAIAEIFRRACRSIACPRTAYAWTAGDEWRRGREDEEEAC